MKKTGLNEYAYEFNVDYNNYISANYSEFISYIHKYVKSYVKV